MFRTLFMCAFACSAASAAKEKCATKCEVDGDSSTLNFKAADVLMTKTTYDAAGDQNDVTVALAKALEDVKDGKDVTEDKLNALMDQMAKDYREDLDRLNDENEEKYGNFLNNHEEVVELDTYEQARLKEMKDSSQDCQSKFLVMQTKETDETLSGWDHTDEDGLTELEGNDMGEIATKYNKPNFAGSECKPALISGCNKDQVTEPIWGYNYDDKTHTAQVEACEDREDGAECAEEGPTGLWRTTTHRHFVNDECPNLVGSSCNTACPALCLEYDDDTGECTEEGTAGVDIGSNVMYTCGADGNWEAELKEYSKIRVFTHVTEQELDEWAAYRDVKVDSTFFTDAWPKMLNLNVDLEDHDPIVTLQSYLDYRGIACNVWAAKFAQEHPSTDPNKISQMLTSGDADGAAIFLETGSDMLASGGNSLKGTDFVEIPPALCSSVVRKASVENGPAFTIPGEYNFKVRGGKKVIQVVFENRLCHGGNWSPGNYATRYSGPGAFNPEDCRKKLLTDTQSHGGQGCSPDIFGVSSGNGHCWCVPKSGRWRAATEDCDAFNYGTSHTWKLAQGMVDAPAKLDCDNKYVDVSGDELAVDTNTGFDPNVLVPAGTGLPKQFAKRNADPNYGANYGWYFRVANQEGTAWDYVKQGMDGVEESEDEAEKDGWSSDKILKTTNGLMHGPFSTDDFARSTQVHKTFTMPVGATSCTVSFRYMRQWTWDHEWGYMHINDKQVWSRKGASTCNNYDWKQWANDMPGISGNANHDCYYDAVIQDIPCPAGEDFKVGFSSNIASSERDESWGFTNFKLHINGVQGDIAGLTVHHFDVAKEGTMAPNGKSDNFDWAYSAERAKAYDCGNVTGGTYAHKTYASYKNLNEMCPRSLNFEPAGIGVDPIMELDASLETSKGPNNIKDIYGGMTWRHTGNQATKIVDGMPVWDLDYYPLERVGTQNQQGDYYTHVYWLKWRATNSGWRTLFRHNQDHCLIVYSGRTELGFYSNRNGGYRGTGHQIRPDKWVFVAVVGTPQSSRNSAGTSTYYIGDADGVTEVARTTDRVCSGNTFYRVGWHNQGPGKLSYAASYGVNLEPKQIETLWKIKRKDYPWN